jgi:hypothetical protein
MVLKIHHEYSGGRPQTTPHENDYRRYLHHYSSQYMEKEHRIHQSENFTKFEVEMKSTNNINKTQLTSLKSNI